MQTRSSKSMPLAEENLRARLCHLKHQNTVGPLPESWSLPAGPSCNVAGPGGAAGLPERLSGPNRKGQRIFLYMLVIERPREVPVLGALSWAGA